ncbi:MAG: nuclear transport factor 2 family protein [Elainellaceae cyanobacterium]
MSLSWAGGVNAQSSNEVSPPAEISEALSQIDRAASQENLGDVLEFYSPEFTSSDGMTIDALEEALKIFWERFSNVRYETQLISWEQEDDSIIVETLTTITGTQDLAQHEFDLVATIESRQQFENQKITRQEILSETSQMTSGENPPSVDMILPEQVGIGQRFALDAIVLEPLGDDLLVGAAIEEPVQPSGYIVSAPVNLEVLSAGGLFKVGQAPAIPENRWISTVIIREDGITMTSQRLQVVSQSSTPTDTDTSTNTD